MKRRDRSAAWRAALAALALLGGCSVRDRGYPVVTPEHGVVPVPLSGIGAGEGRFFAYRAPGGGRAEYLVYRESDGTPRAVLNACRECARWKKGYALEGGSVVCLKCGMRFKIDALAAGTGSCVPIALPATRDGDRILIPVADLEAGTRNF
jgi:uncharacterized membrane protein